LEDVQDEIEEGPKNFHSSDIKNRRFETKFINNKPTKGRKNRCQRMKSAVIRIESGMILKKFLIKFR